MYTQYTGEITVVAREIDADSNRKGLRLCLSYEGSRMIFVTITLMLMLAFNAQLWTRVQGTLVNYQGME